MKNSRLYLIFFVLITLVAFFLRFWKLGEVPNGLYQDETAIGYNAYSIIQTGRDEYGKNLPLYFKSFGDYKLPIYIYATVPSVIMFGLTEFAVRAPSALFGALSVPLLGLLIYALTADKRLSIFGMLLLAVNPWHLHYSRATFEVSISLFLFMLGALLLHKSFYSKTRGLFLAGTVSFILALYTYNLTRLLSPLLFLVLLFFERDKIKSVSRTELIISAIASCVLLIPFLASLFNAGGASSASGTLILSSAAVQAPLLEFRSYFIYAPTFVTTLFMNKFILSLWQYINNIFSYFSVDFFFIRGSLHGNHGIGNVGLFYLFELPLIILGISKVIRKKMRWGIFIAAWGVIVIAVAALTRDVPHATRSFFLLVPLIVFSALGLKEIADQIHKIRKHFLKVSIITACALFVSYNLFYYFSSYYGRFPTFYAKRWQASDKEVVKTILKNKDKYDKIIFDSKAGFPYTSYLFYSAYPPKDFQDSVKRQPDDSEGFSVVDSFGKFEFRDIDWTKDLKSPKTLILTTADRKPAELTPIKTFYFPKRPIVIAVKQEVLGYPFEEVSYVLVSETK